MHVTMNTRCQVEVLGSAAAHALAGDGTTAEHGCASSMCHSLSQCCAVSQHSRLLPTQASAKFCACSAPPLQVYYG